MEDRRSLRRSLRCGAVYDLCVGLAILIAGPSLVERFTGAPPPSLFHFHLAALPLFLLPVFYWSAARARSIDGFRAGVLWARLGGGGLVLLATLLDRPVLWGVYVVVGLLDWGFGALHFGLWNRGRS